MKNRMTTLVFVIGVLFACAAVSRAQATKASASGKAAASDSASTPDLSGVWISATAPAREALLAEGKTDEARKKEARPITSENDEADESAYRHTPYPMLPWAEEKYKYNLTPSGGARSELTPYLANCSPQGPTVDWQFQNFPFEIIQSPKRVLIIFERDHEIRQIWTDGREHPKDFGHNWMGHSIGHWEGNTLVADTIGLNDLTWLDKAGHVHSDQLHLIERLQRVAPDKMRLDITVDDPKTFTKPWTAFKTFKRTNYELEEEILCEDKFLGRTIPLE
jgi:hypothetical protein